MKSAIHRVISIFTCLIMALTLLPVTAVAVKETEKPEQGSYFDIPVTGYAVVLNDIGSVSLYSRKVPDATDAYESVDKSSQLTALEAGDQLTLLAYEDEWYYAADEEGNEGWIYESAVACPWDGSAPVRGIKDIYIDNDVIIKLYHDGSIELLGLPFYRITADGVEKPYALSDRENVDRFEYTKSITGPMDIITVTEDGKFSYAFDSRDAEITESWSNLNSLYNMNFLTLGLGNSGRVNTFITWDGYVDNNPAVAEIKTWKNIKKLAVGWIDEGSVILGIDKNGLVHNASIGIDADFSDMRDVKDIKIRGRALFVLKTNGQAYVRSIDGEDEIFEETNKECRNWAKIKELDTSWGWAGLSTGHKVCTAGFGDYKKEIESWLGVDKLSEQYSGIQTEFPPIGAVMLDGSIVLCSALQEYLGIDDFELSLFKNIEKLKIDLYRGGIIGITEDGAIITAGFMDCPEINHYLQPGIDPEDLISYGPSGADILSGGKKIYSPNDGSYLPAYEAAWVKAPGKQAVNVFSTPFLQDVNSNDFIIGTVGHKSPVTVMARENKCSCIITPRGLVGWVPDNLLSLSPLKFNE